MMMKVVQEEEEVLVDTSGWYARVADEERRR